METRYSACHVLAGVSGVQCAGAGIPALFSSQELPCWSQGASGQRPDPRHWVSA